ncbi:MAG TPA: formylmethanofuran dehydrogenase [Clostridiaceae bacterium]|nr:formylmethanofuran dehydrogenase [Clostridiaceae bacterium]
MDEKTLWYESVAFHGHECTGLTIGYKAALYAMELLNLTRAADEEVVCVSENDACGVDAIQAILSCTIGKGNLLFHLTGKQAFSFYERKSGKSVRLVLRPMPTGLSREASFALHQSKAPQELFEVKKAVIQLPERARIFDSYICADCGERTGSQWMRLRGEDRVCRDCFKSYSRFDI